MTSFILRETMLAHLLLYGNAYCQIIRTGRDKIDSLYPLLPDKMEVDRDAGGLLTYTYTTSDGKRWRLEPRDVLHIPGLGFDGVMGYSPIALEKSAIGLGIAAEEYGSKFFSNGARPSGILTHPNTVKDPAALRASWNAAYRSSSNASRVAVLEEGMTFVPLSLPNNEAQFLETRKFQVSEICRIFRVPPHMIGDLDRATFSNIEHQSIDFAVHTIRPWLVRIEQAVNRALFLFCFQFIFDIIPPTPNGGYSGIFPRVLSEVCLLYPFLPFPSLTFPCSLMPFAVVCSDCIYKNDRVIATPSRSLCHQLRFVWLLTCNM